ncbi:hypothetical protein HDU97_005700 [Phlyctochytrium planicorne]|nr:hypothetical protein HDU97_005700 [Phlyctochytrium planicorne]
MTPDNSLSPPLAVEEPATATTTTTTSATLAAEQPHQAESNIVNTLAVPKTARQNTQTRKSSNNTSNHDDDIDTANVTSVTAQFHGDDVAAGATTLTKEDANALESAAAAAGLSSSAPPTSIVKFGITPDEILDMLDPKSPEKFAKFGGVDGIARRLRSNVRTGISKSYDERMGLFRTGTVRRGASSASSRSAVSTIAPSIGTSISSGDDDHSIVESDMEDDESLMPPSSIADDATSINLPPAPEGIQPSKTMVEDDSNAFPDRKAVFGDNTLPPPHQQSFWAFAFEALKDKTLLVLCGAAVVDMIIGIYKSVFAPKKDPIAFVDGLAIVIAVVVIVMISAANDYRKQAQFRKLSDYSKSLAQTQVIRDGVTRQLPNARLLVGDVCQVGAGDVLPADGIVLQSFNLSCDESSLTGEGVAVPKDTVHDPFLLSGTRVTAGVGRYMIVGTGRNSINGRLLAALEVEPEETPLQKKLGKLADQIGKFGLFASIFLVVGLMIVYIIFKVRKGGSETVTIVNDVINVFIIGVTLVVVAIPEGLPLAVTMALAHATLRMLKDNNLVRHLKACETMGNATTVCSDKTGTLTQNKMTVVAGKISGRDFRNEEADEDEVRRSFDSASGDMAKKPTSGDAKLYKISEIPGQMHKTILAHFARCVNVNTTADEVENAEGVTEFVGSKTEIALLEFTKKLGYAYKPHREAAEVVEVIPFSSERKRMSTVIKCGAKGDAGVARLEKYLYGGGATHAKLDVSAAAPEEEEGEAVLGMFPKHTSSSRKCWLFCKGAAEIVLQSCEFYVDREGRVRKMTDGVRDRVGRLIEGMAGRALRTICVAFKPVVRKKDDEKDGENVEGGEGDAKVDEKKEDEFGLVLAMIVGIEDPIRPEVPDAVASCHRAGIVVRMVTGDNIATAKSIAERARIYTPGSNDVVMEGPDFRQLTPEMMDQILPRLRVLARSSPMDKQILVNNLKRLGETVAVTGDGTNDAPALRSADVGFSMGIAGTEVAKEASDIVLLDDNFVSLSKAIMWGRSVYDSVRKFLQFQLTVNVVAVFVTIVSSFLTACFSKENTPYSILSAVQLLWVNLIMDTFAALALATDPPTPELLDRPPARKSDPLINFAMWKMIVGQSLYQIAVCMGLYLVGSQLVYQGQIINNDQKDTDTGVDGNTTTMVFNAFVFCQVFNELNSRVIGNALNVFKDIHKNHMFTGIVVGTVIVQVIIVQFGGAAFKTEALSGRDWAICIGLGLGSLPVGVLIRLTPDWLVAPFLGFLTKEKKEKDDDEEESTSETEEDKGVETVEMLEVVEKKDSSSEHHLIDTPKVVVVSATMDAKALAASPSASGSATSAPKVASAGRGEALWTRARDVKKQIGVVNAFRGTRHDWAAAQLGAMQQRPPSSASRIRFAEAGASGEKVARDDASIVSSHLSTAV